MHFVVLGRNTVGHSRWRPIFVLFYGFVGIQLFPNFAKGISVLWFIQHLSRGLIDDGSSKYNTRPEIYHASDIHISEMKIFDIRNKTHDIHHNE